MPAITDYIAIAEDLFINMIYNEEHTIAQCSDGVDIELKPDFNYFTGILDDDNAEVEQYFFHSDHLGSSSWITDADGYVNQHLQYMPFGETFVDQRSGNDVRFKFTGKERDSETGFDYFGARYYASDLSVWLSVDPLAILSPGISPYAYVNNNPIMLIDEWGLTPGPIKKIKQWLNRVKRGIKVKKVPHVTEEFDFAEKNTISNENVSNKLTNSGTAEDGIVPFTKKSRVNNKYIQNADRFRINFLGSGSSNINITKFNGEEGGEIIFRGGAEIPKTDWISLRRNKRRIFSVNYEKVFIFSKTKEFEIINVFKKYTVSANITASQTWFDHMEKMNARIERKKKYLRGETKTF